MKTSHAVRVPSLVLAVAVAGCSSLETSITQPEETTMQLVVEVAETGTSNSVAPGPSLNIVLEDGDGNTLSLAGAAIVVRELAFRRQEGEGCVDADGSGEPDEDSCAEILIDPDLLELPIDRDPIASGPIVVEPGTYDALVFELHETRQEDLNVVDQRPGMVGASVSVAGSYNGTSLGDSALFNPTGEVVLPLDDPIELNANFASGMTLTVDVASWFRLEEGLVDPSAAAGDTALARQVSENILDSFSIRAGT